MKTTFNYTAKTDEGNDVKGQVLASSHDGAYDYLQEQNYTDITVKRRFEVDELY